MALKFLVTYRTTGCLGDTGQFEKTLSKEGHASLSSPIHSKKESRNCGVSGRQGLAHSTHLPIAQQNNPHQDNIDVGPQRLIMIDFVDLKDNQGGISRNHVPKYQLWFCKWRHKSIGSQVRTQGTLPHSFFFLHFTQRLPFTLNHLLIYPSTFCLHPTPSLQPAPPAWIMTAVS